MKRYSKIIFVGSNPPERSGTTEPFANCKSGNVLKTWVNYLQLDSESIVLLNVVDYPTPSNRTLNSAEIRRGSCALRQKLSKYENFFVVCLGRTAAKAVKMAVPEFSKLFELPHPSPSNRSLNGKTLPEILDNLKRILHSE